MFIGITTRIIYEDGIKKQFVNEAYIEYVKLAGFTPIILPMLTDIDDLLNLCDAFLITGGDDLHSQWYNEPLSPKAGTTHIEMDEADKNVIEYGGNIYDESFVAIVDNVPVGFIIGKTWHRELVVGNYDKAGWISLIYVKPKFRNMGIGSLLLNKVEEIFVDKEMITLKKFSKFSNMEEMAKKLADILCHSVNKHIFVTDSDTFIAASGSLKKKYIGGNLSSFLEDIFSNVVILFALI